MVYATDGKLGVNLVSGATADASQQFALGETARVDGNKVAIYVYANEAIASGTGVELAAAFTASASAGGIFTSVYAIASGEYGWVHGPDIQTLTD